MVAGWLQAEIAVPLYVVQPGDHWFVGRVTSLQTRIAWGQPRNHPCVRGNKLLVLLWKSCKLAPEQETSALALAWQ